MEIWGRDNRGIQSKLQKGLDVKRLKEGQKRKQ